MADTIIIWFRRDLRLNDNPALAQAAQAGNVLPLFVLDERQELAIGGAVNGGCITP
ncbi:deoxyribodipyrimidine photo-lyase [Spirosoma sp. KNUC1025]|uniref:deoxyribodipyrimidine photo-lyase n=1 Tax=Spirosoma sp. KNUC1025 TaxID=2894082 RepID=UPI0021054D52|nr:deoxyribodipyrimidine photo-lyase [Spirosoma sp. KNUC1025]